MTMPAPFRDAAGRLAVRAGRLLDPASGTTLPDRTILVSDGVVEAVLGPADGLPDGTPVVDLGGLTVLPGLSPLVAIRSATGVAAECLGRADHVGLLEPGRYPDLVGVADDPLTDVTTLGRPVVVMKGGRVALDRRVTGAPAA